MVFYKMAGSQGKQTRLLILVLALVVFTACKTTHIGLVAVRDRHPVLGIHHFKGSNAVATHGELVLHHGCITLKMAAGLLQMLAWPSDFAVNGNPQAFRVLDGQGRIVAASGDRVRLGGGPIGPAAISTTDNHALPSKCRTDHMFAVDRGTVQRSKQVSSAGTSDSSSPSDHPHHADFKTLTAAAEAGTFDWRCSDGGQAVIRLTVDRMSASDIVRVYAGGNLVGKRQVDPGQHLSVPMPSSSDQLWRIKQATEPRTLVVTARFGPNPVTGCATYLSPTVHLRSVSRSH